MLKPTHQMRPLGGDRAGGDCVNWSGRGLVEGVHFLSSLLLSEDTGFPWIPGPVATMNFQVPEEWGINFLINYSALDILLYPYEEAGDRRLNGNFSDFILLSHLLILYIHGAKQTTKKTNNSKLQVLKALDSRRLTEVLEYCQLLLSYIPSSNTALKLVKTKTVCFNL